MLEEGERMVILIEFIERPNIFLIEVNNGHLAGLCDMDQDRVQLSRVGVLFLSLVFIIYVDLFFRHINIS